MEENKSIVLGLVGGIVLLYFRKLPLPTAGWFTDYFLFPIISFIGATLVLFFSIWLIVDALKTIFKK